MYIYIYIYIYIYKVKTHLSYSNKNKCTYFFLAKLVFTNLCHDVLKLK